MAKNEKVAKTTEISETSEVKFSEDELQSLQNLQTGYQEKQAMLGQIAVQRIVVSQQMDALEARQVELEGEYGNVQEEERELVKKLNDKYGPGTLDPQSGVFTPTPTDQ